MLDEIRGCNHRLDGRLQIGAAAASDMAHRQLIRDHQDITSLFGRVYSPIVISVPPLFRREPRFIDLMDKHQFVSQTDRVNEWRSEERRVGEEEVSRCRCWWSP